MATICTKLRSVDRPAVGNHGWVFVNKRSFGRIFNCKTSLKVGCIVSSRTIIEGDTVVANAKV